jgi:putative transposase
VSEVELRRRAVGMVEDGERVSDVAEVLGRSREWVHKWVRRFAQEGEAGLEDRSRRPQSPPVSIDAATVTEVLRVRAELEDNPVASVGASSVQAAMERARWASIPSVPSIERILRRAGRTRPYRRRQRGDAKLPIPSVTKPGVWQQVDWVQDRWLEGGICFQSIQAVDVASGVIASGQYLNRQISTATEFLFENAWPVLSIPLTMGIDNAFINTTHPNNPFTVFARLCLFYGSEVLVAPPGGLGWTNQAESANNLWQARTTRARHFTNIEELRAGSDEACHWLNHYRPLHDPELNGSRYPLDMIKHHAPTLRWPPTDTLTDHRDTKGNIRIPLATGRITYIRHTSEHHTIKIARTTWPVPDPVPIGAIVTATITTTDQTLTLRHRGEPLATHPYPINHPIIDSYYPPAQHGLLDHMSAIS